MRRRLGIFGFVLASVIFGMAESGAIAQVTDPYTQGTIAPAPAAVAGAAASEDPGIGLGSASAGKGAEAARVQSADPRRGFARTGMDLLPWILIALLCIVAGRTMLNESNRKRRKIAQRRKTRRTA